MGMFIIKDGRQARGHVPARSIYDIAPTVLKEFDIDVPETMRGQPI
jgi:bisphosphoglycerate-independent phosphoglycerate mutase (AlkP superfamily)